MPKPNEISAEAIGESEVRAQLELIAARRLEGSIGFDKDMAMATAALSRALVGFENERRQQAKNERRQLASYALDQIVDYLRGLPEATLAGVIRDLTGSDREEPLL